MAWGEGRSLGAELAACGGYPDRQRMTGEGEGGHGVPTWSTEESQSPVLQARQEWAGASWGHCGRRKGGREDERRAVPGCC